MKLIIIIIIITDGKRPDGVTLLPWNQGKCVTWDVTVSDTLAQSYLHETYQTPGAAAEATAERKTNKYTSLAHSYLFVAVAAETMGAINKDGMDFLSDLGSRITQSTETTTAGAPSSSSDFPFIGRDLATI